MSLFEHENWNDDRHYKMKVEIMTKSRLDINRLNYGKLSHFLLDKKTWHKSLLWHKSQLEHTNVNYDIKSHYEIKVEIM